MQKMKKEIKREKNIERKIWIYEEKAFIRENELVKRPARGRNK